MDCSAAEGIGGIVGGRWRGRSGLNEDCGMVSWLWEVWVLDGEGVTEEVDFVGFWHSQRESVWDVMVGTE